VREATSPNGGALPGASSDTRNRLTTCRPPLREMTLRRPGRCAGTVNVTLNDPRRPVRVLPTTRPPARTTTRSRLPKSRPSNDVWVPADPEAGINITLLSATADWGSELASSVIPKRNATKLLSDFTVVVHDRTHESANRDEHRTLVHLIPARATDPSRPIARKPTETSGSMRSSNPEQPARRNQPCSTSAMRSPSFAAVRGGRY
jgi:hypothetical protein